MTPFFSDIGQFYTRSVTVVDDPSESTWGWRFLLNEPKKFVKQLRLDLSNIMKYQNKKMFDQLINNRCMLPVSRNMCAKVGLSGADSHNIIQTLVALLAYIYT